MAQATLRYNPAHTEVQVILPDETFFEPSDFEDGQAVVYQDDDGKSYLVAIGAQEELEDNTIYQLVPLPTTVDTEPFEVDEEEDEEDDTDDEDSDEDEEDEEEEDE